MFSRYYILLLLIVFSASFNLSCSDSTNETNSSPNSVKAVGVVNSVNSSQSVSINGVNYNTSSSSISSEDNQPLDVGMVVSADGDMDEDHNTCVAHDIMYEAQIKGVVTANDIAMSGTLYVMGQTVVVDDITVFVSEDPNYDTLISIPVEAVGEVSGFMLKDGSIKATRIELVNAAYEAGMLLKIKGVITDVGDMYFKIQDLTVMYDDNTVFHKLTKQDIAVGLYVKVTSTQAFDPMAMNLLADSIMLKKHGIDAGHGDKVEIYGVVTSEGVADNMFELNGQHVIITKSTLFVHGTIEDIVQGVMLQAKGRMDENDNLVAEKIKFDNPNHVKIMGLVEEVNPEESYLKVMGARIYVDDMTWFKDHPHYAPNHPQNPEPMVNSGTVAMQSFQLSDIEPGNFVKVMAGYSQQGGLMAYKVERKKPDHPANVEVEGPVTAIDSLAHMIEVVGVKVDVSAYANVSVTVGDKAMAKGTYDEVLMTLMPVEFSVELK